MTCDESPFRLQNRWPTVDGFLRTIEWYWPTRVHKAGHFDDVWTLRCPACTPGDHDWHSWTLAVYRRGEGWGHFASCSCSAAVIAMAVLGAKKEDPPAPEE
jgi:hypothetical protein